MWRDRESAMRNGRRQWWEGFPCRSSDGIAESIKLLPRHALLVEWRVVVVAGGIWLEVRAITVGAIHPAETGASMKHVHTYGVILAEHPFEFLRLTCPIGLMMLLAPMIEPTCPVFAADARSGRP